MNFKRVLSIICIIALILSLCACSGEDDKKTSSAATSSAQEITSSKESGSSSEAQVSSNSSVSSVTSTVSKVEGVVVKPCETHDYDLPTCEEDSYCKICGALCCEAYGHFYFEGICRNPGCGKAEPGYMEWFTDGEITITKSQADKIISQTYKKPKNVIVMIGDGMGAVDVQLAELRKTDCFNFGLTLNRIVNTGYATTHSMNSSVTDSAASGTALATGYKTNNGMIGMLPTGEILTNVSEIARKAGKKVGIVTNDEIVGATPSAFTVHNKSRNNTSELAEAFIKFKPDVLIGQGQSRFRNLDLSGFLNSTTIREVNALLSTDPNSKKPYLGFISESYYGSPSNTLAYYTEIALNRLKNNKDGFFLMVENAATDKAGHDNKFEEKLNGVITFDRAVAVVLKFMEKNPDTLLVITSDHETGGLTYPAYATNYNQAYFTTSSHTGADVRTFAVGYGSEYFKDTVVDNTDVANFVINALQGK